MHTLIHIVPHRLVHGVSGRVISKEIGLMTRDRVPGASELVAIEHDAHLIDKPPTSYACNMSAFE